MVVNILLLPAQLHHPVALGVPAAAVPPAIDINSGEINVPCWFWI